MNLSEPIKIAQLGAAHGLRGQIKIRCFLDDPSLLERISPITDSMGTVMRVRLVNAEASTLIASLDGVNDRTQAEGLRNRELFTTPQALEAVLPEDDAEAGEFLHQLVGLQARLEDGSLLGTIHAVYNFGASDILEIKDAASEQLSMIAYTHATIPTVHIDEGYLVVRVPEVM